MSAQGPVNGNGFRAAGAGNPEGAPDDGVPPGRARLQPCRPAGVGTAGFETSSRATNDLHDVLAEPTCIVGMGNPWRNDDGIGVHVAQQLSGRAGLPPHIQVINVEDVIESYAFDIANRQVRNVVLVDAVASAGMPVGAVVFGKVDELEAVSSNVSTHKLALRTVESVFRRAGKDTYLLGIVSANIDFGNEISAPVRAAADRLVDLVCRTRSI